jgi:group II intron reverse transcriptase/maturase
MVSLNSKQRKQKISQETCSQREAVNTLGYARGLSMQSTQTNESIREVNHNNLMEQVLEKSNLEKAYQRVMRNKGAPGVDGVTVENLRPHLWDNWGRIKEELLNGTYKPQPVRRVEIPKPDGGMRLLGIPTVIDRLIQQALLQILTPVFDPTFSSFSYGFRPGRSAHQAVKQAQKYVQQGYRYVVDIDLEKFFDRVNHDILMSKVAKKIKDKRILRAIRRYLQSGVMINGCCMVTDEGTPQGGPLSPLLANIMLHELDQELTSRGHCFVRYADDCNIYVKSKRAGMRVLESVTKFVERRLKLKVNHGKSAADRPWNRKILGFSFTRVKAAVIRIAPKTRDKFQDKIRELTRRSRSQNLFDRIEKINTYLKGWIGYFYVAQTRSVFEDLDKWIRRRMRACLLKQWKKCQTKRRQLVSFGLSKEWASYISRSRKKYWRLSRTHQLNKVLGLAYWQAQGLISLVERYDKLSCAL